MVFIFAFVLVPCTLNKGSTYSYPDIPNFLQCHTVYRCYLRIACLQDLLQAPTFFMEIPHPCPRHECLYGIGGRAPLILNLDARRK